MRIALLSATLLAAALLAGPTAAATPAAHLSLATASPFVVRGTHFAARERVTISVFVVGKTTREVLSAGSLGTFVARFPTVHLARCPAYTVTASGSDGSHARLHVLTDCPAGPTP